jgi:ketosteroid isomerase-like protein
MNPTEIVEALWAAFDSFEFAAAAPLLHDEFVCEFPQSGEVMRGRDNFIAMNQHYPGQWRCTIQQLIANGDKVVTETHVSDGNQSFTALSFFTFKDNQIIHLREYWPDPMPAQEWRAQWVEKRDA